MEFENRGQKPGDKTTDGSIGPTLEDVASKPLEDRKKGQFTKKERPLDDGQDTGHQKNA